jgi:prohibitin 1
MSVQTQEIKEVAEVPSQEGLILSLETSLLFQLDPAKAVDIYRTVGADYVRTIVEPQFRSAIREITASYEAKALYSAEREKIAGEIFTLFRRIAGERERKRIEAQAVTDFQRILAQGISPQLLEWKGIEATEKLAASANTKIVVIGNSRTGLPLILGGER